MPSYKTQAIVLKKTKLKDADLILGFLAEDGSKKKCVAKSARKSGSGFSAKLDFFRIASLMLHEGRNLDTVTEAKTIKIFDGIRSSIFKSAFAYTMLEFAENVALEGQGDATLFPITQTALEALDSVEEKFAFAFSVAYIIKLCAYQGFKPEFAQCVICGRDLEFSAEDIAKFSVPDGGSVCEECCEILTPNQDFVLVSWVHLLIRSKFSDLESALIDAGFENDVARINKMLCNFISEWIWTHLGLELKSMPYAGDLLRNLESV